MPSVRGGDEDSVALMARIAGGDREAFARFYDAMSGAAFGLIRRIVRDSAAAEEVLQEVFLQAWREAGRYDPGRGSPEAWLVMRARTRAIDRLRSMRRRDRTFGAPLAESAARGEESAEADPGVAAEARDMMQAALGALPPPQRRVIELAFLEGLTQAEIAARLGEPLGTVKTRSRLGLERLRTILGGRAGIR